MDPRRHRHRLRAVLSKLNNETVAKAVLFFVERLRFFDIQPAVQVKYGNFLFVFTPLRGVKTRVNSRFCFLYSTRCAGQILEFFICFYPAPRGKNAGKFALLFSSCEEKLYCLFPAKQGTNARIKFAYYSHERKNIFLLYSRSVRR